MLNYQRVSVILLSMGLVFPRPLLGTSTLSVRSDAHRQTEGGRGPNLIGCYQLFACFAGLDIHIFRTQQDTVSNICG